MKTHNDQRFIDQFLSNHRSTAVAAVEALEIDEIALLLQHVAPDKAKIILAEINPYKAGKVLEGIPVTSVVNVVKALPTNISEPILRMIDPSFRQQILAELPPEVNKPLRRSLTLSRNQVGAHLEPSFLTLTENSTIEKALSEIKTTSATIQSHIFVVENKKLLVGYLEVSDLLSNSPEKIVRSVMKPAPSAITATMLVKDVLESWDDSFAYLPVVNAENRLIGIVSRGTLSKLAVPSVGTDRLAVKAGSALGDLYLIGLAGLLGSSDQTTNT
ncbi:MAG: CBS domain-containing protein [Bacteroidota bacterium]